MEKSFIIFWIFWICYGISCFILGMQLEKYKEIRFCFWAKYGHWCKVSFWRAMDHWIRGGKIKIARA